MIRVRRFHAVVSAVVLVTLVSCHGMHARSARAPVGSTTTSPRITMAALHQAGGVPPGWQFTPPAGDPAAGRQVFVNFGCYTCHTVQGEQFPSPDDRHNPGPDLTGMGKYHPAAYFVESILDPNAVVVDGPGYVGPDGRSIMPTYPEMTLAQLTNVVAYLQSLRGDSTQHAHMHHTAASFLVQAVDVAADQFYAYDDWFDQRGAQLVKGVNGLVSVDTYVTRTPKGRLVITVFGFEDDVVLDDFVKRLDTASPADELRTLLHLGANPVFRSPPVYKAIGLSVP